MLAGGEAADSIENGRGEFILEACGRHVRFVSAVVVVENSLAGAFR